MAVFLRDASFGILNLVSFIYDDAGEFELVDTVNVVPGGLVAHQHFKPNVGTRVKCANEGLRISYLPILKLLSTSVRCAPS